MVEELKCFYFLEQAVPDLKKELPTHLAAAEGVLESVELLEWWKKHKEKLILENCMSTGSTMSAIFSCY